MSDFTNRIETVDMGGLSDFQRIDQNLRALIVSIAETIPGSRGFGLSADIPGLPPAEAQNMFAMELDEKVEEFIPEITIASIDFDMSGGVMSLCLYVEGNSEYEEVEEE
ncbi:MAG: hypothetical protein LUC83_03025 [Clostridiales bacterium]|nr:hypothetical protein [Clostridiales bacterium]